MAAIAFNMQFKILNELTKPFDQKIKKDEKELHIPAAFLIKLGYMSFEFLKSNISIGDKCTLIQEENNLQDKRGI